MERLKNVNGRIAEDLHRDLKIQAAAERRPLQCVLADAILAYLQAHEQPDETAKRFTVTA